MLRRLRIQLTVIYMLAGILLMVILGAGLYWRLDQLFSNNNRSGLKVSTCAGASSAYSAPISPALEEAEQDWERQPGFQFPDF